MRSPVESDFEQRTRELNAARELFFEIIRQHSDAILIVDEKETVLLANPAAESLLGKSAQELVGAPFGFSYPISDSTPRVINMSLGANSITVEMRAAEIEWERKRARLITLRRRAPQDKMEAARIFIRQLIEERESERRQLARALYDEIGQTLTAIKINLQARSLFAGIYHETLTPNEIFDIIDRAVERVRELSFDLHPSLLDDLGLDSALRWYLEERARKFGCEARLVSDLKDARLPSEIEIACYRIAQEALNSIQRDADDARIELKLRRSPQQLELIVRGEAKEHNSASNLSAEGLGLLTMRERVASVGGCLDVNSSTDKGATLRVVFPLRA
jgi:signal transduction histidine kinase